MRTRRTVSLIVIALLTTAAAPASAVAASPHHRTTTAAPTRSQIATAVARVERSRKLWATVNICNTTSHPYVVGIRGQMPALGFNSLLTMDIELRYWSVTEKRYKPLPHSRQTISLGTKRIGLHQSGLSFQFDPHAGTLAGTVRFEWRLKRRSIGRTTRQTSAAHPDADQGDPAHFSAGKCAIS
jgi:hypothetical protein